jgi:hypothetical protein
MMMTNAVLQKLFNDYGTDVIGLALNNSKFLTLNYKNSPSNDDVEFDTIEGVDVIKVHQVDDTNNNEYTSIHVTEFVEGVIVTKDNNYIDPRHFR